MTTEIISEANRRRTFAIISHPVRRSVTRSFTAFDRASQLNGTPEQ
ncbi:MAG: hypothetical protein ACKN9F_01525 [Methylomonas sp.]